MDHRKPLHIAFGMSAADSVRKALRQLGCNERVIGFPDDLSFGPIDCAESGSRETWISKELGNQYGHLCLEADRFWSEVTSPAVSLVVWFCRNHALEHAGYLEFVWRLKQTPFELIDASDVTPRRGPMRQAGLWSLGVLTPVQIIEAGLFERRTTVSNDDRGPLRDLWRRLRTENAPFRVVGANGLMSVPITHFDDAIMACVTSEWRKGARVVGDAMAELLDRPFSQCPSDMILWSRVLALAERDRCVIDGPGPAMRDFRVRLSAAGPQQAMGT